MPHTYAFTKQIQESKYPTKQSSPNMASHAARPPSLTALPLKTRRNALLFLLVSLVLARSGPLVNLEGLGDKITLKAWRLERQLRAEEKRRRQMETPL